MASVHVCTCSGPGRLGCQPEGADATSESDPDSESESVLARKDTNPIPKAKRLTRVMRAAATERLIRFRDTIYLSSSSAVAELFPPSVFFPDPTMKTILDRFALLSSPGALHEILMGRTYLLPHENSLWIILEELRETFAAMRKTTGSRPAPRKCDVMNTGACVAEEGAGDELGHVDMIEARLREEIQRMTVEWDIGFAQDPMLCPEDSVVLVWDGCLEVPESSKTACAASLQVDPVPPHMTRGDTPDLVAPRPSEPSSLQPNLDPIIPVRPGPVTRAMRKRAGTVITPTQNRPAKNRRITVEKENSTST